MKAGILGAGISGLSMARLLKNDFDEVEVLEKNKFAGGIARTKDVDGVPYHLVGGHCFNSKYPEVLDFVFNEVLPINEWRKIKRKSKIRFHQHEVDYPIEFAVKQIYSFDKDLALKIVADFLNASDDRQYANLEEWFIKKFGKTLADEYFIPYNAKIWNNHPRQMSHSWVEDKLPIPNKYDFFDSLAGNADDQMPHAEFYYPVSNNQNTFIDALAKGLKIIFGYPVNDIRFDPAQKQWIINNDRKYDLIISTLPLKEIPFLLEDTPDAIKSAGEKLKYNKVSNTLWKTQLTDKTWTYIPAKELLFHRYIHIGAYLNPLFPCSISEVIGEHSPEEMKKSGKNDPFLLEALDHHVSDYAYVVFDENYRKSTSIIKDYLHEKQFHTLGRFGEWQYYNMDICIKKAMELREFLLSQEIAGQARNDNNYLKS
ncbi:MAG: NAD(P)-binding protein [Dysgonamonadaceae bacterium]|jgi:protoporphyrinogen oxidase|nr:NAD(P)-binding protein [Dysgonamonadaceae bacterium]